MSSKRTKGPVLYEIQGYYPAAHFSWLRKQDPRQWHREWRVWHTTRDIREARETMRAGKYLCHRTCPISYSMLRIVQVTSQGRKVLK